MESELGITNDLVCAIEKMYRFDTGKGRRLRMIPQQEVFRIMRKYYLGVHCLPCLSKEPGQRFCCLAHKSYFSALQRLLTWSWASRRAFANATTCAICGELINRFSLKDGLSVDHRVPLARGGLEFDRTNMQPAHFSCNSRKGAK